MGTLTLAEELQCCSVAPLFLRAGGLHSQGLAGLCVLVRRSSKPAFRSRGRGLRPTWVSSHQGWSNHCKIIVRNLLYGPTNRTGKYRHFPGGVETNEDFQGLKVSVESWGGGVGRLTQRQWWWPGLMRPCLKPLVGPCSFIGKKLPVGFVKTWASHLFCLSESDFTLRVGTNTACPEGMVARLSVILGCCGAA